MKRFIVAALAFVTFTCSAQINIFHCGDYTITNELNKVPTINGQKVSSLKVTILGDTGLKEEMTLMPASDGNSYGFMYMHPAGNNDRWLVVQLLQASMNAPTMAAKYPCTREVK
ncbi:hypothetical protein [Rosenbergiella collisarenosi]|uniref:hypothetical protein n=1 Tax=Rosenbergiella collisarenosi TaxID=1544695 RepID=UPI001F4DD1EC|nr:hypothetical protein [Rosenbergiella collisarenosi]